MMDPFPKPVTTINTPTRRFKSQHNIKRQYRLGETTTRRSPLDTCFFRRFGDKSVASLHQGGEYPVSAESADARGQNGTKGDKMADPENEDDPTLPDDPSYEEMREYSKEMLERVRDGIEDAKRIRARAEQFPPRMVEQQVVGLNENIADLEEMEYELELLVKLTSRRPRPDREMLAREFIRVVSDDLEDEQG